MVIIDSDVLLLAFAYPKDERQKTNQKFLEAIQTALPATTIYNVMETLGQLSFNLSTDQLNQWQDWMANAHNLESPYAVYAPAGSATLRRNLHNTAVTHRPRMGRPPSSRSA